MDPLIFDLIFTILASLAVLAAGGLAVWVLPWSEEAWSPRERPEPTPRGALPVKMNELADLTTH